MSRRKDNHTSKREPRPTSLRTQISPPCAWTINCTIERLKPWLGALPYLFRRTLRFRSGIEKAAERNGWFPARGIPGSHVIATKRRVHFGFPIEDSKTANALHTRDIRHQVGFGPAGSIHSATKFNLYHWRAVARLKCRDVGDDPGYRRASTAI